ncbi:MAG: iron ABC transporter permease, partial [Lachnospiraceae bacterium]|nr:iron ABC transporter permease [Lachnospiraceae bacterium]
AIAVYSISVSLYSFSFSDAMDIIERHFNDELTDDYHDYLMNKLVFEGTFPRAVGGVIIGAILAVGGAIMQYIIRNPLADSYTTGISSGALFGVTVFVITDLSIFGALGDNGMVLSALIFSMIPCSIMVLFSVKKKATPTMMVLVGIATMYIFSAGTMILKYNAEPEEIHMIYQWSLGSLYKVKWSSIPYLAGALAFLFCFAMYFSGRIDVLSSGDNSAVSLGVNPSFLRVICLAVTSLCTAVAVSFSGTIGFVGLVIPHLARILVGSKSKLLIPCSAVLGGLLLIGADSIARVCGSSSLPVGVLTAIIGTPVFLFFLLKMRGSAWGK